MKGALCIDNIVLIRVRFYLLLLHAVWRWRCRFEVFFFLFFFSDSEADVLAVLWERFPHVSVRLLRFISVLKNVGGNSILPVCKPRRGALFASAFRVPFDIALKRMFQLNWVGNGFITQVDGTVWTILPHGARRGVCVYKCVCVRACVYIYVCVCACVCVH